MFESIIVDGAIEPIGYLIIFITSLLAGAIYSFLCCFRSKSSFNFSIATALIPMAVSIVIVLVNGNLGIGVAIAGAFGLVRFRSAPGTAKEISIIFIGMAAGLAFGMGFIAYGAIFLVSCGLIIWCISRLEKSRFVSSNFEKMLKITIPENLDYTSVFDDLFEKYTSKSSLEQVKSTNMGSMFRLTYRVFLRNPQEEKNFLDDIRTRNGNLEVILSRINTSEIEL